jgi:hypothetical protein
MVIKINNKEKSIMVIDKHEQNIKIDWQTYEREKQKIIAINLPSEEYEQEIERLMERLEM